jgi:c-di-GMP-binding flagellar brake protein YcgR
MQLEIEGFEERLKSSLVGILPDQYLILTLPQLGTYPGQRTHVDVESEILVRYVHRGVVWGFKSRLKRVVSTPVGLLMIEIPSSIESHDLRQEKRIDCLLPGKIKLGKTSRKGAVVDLSKKGCRLVIEIAKGKKAPKIEIDDELALVCSFPGIEGEQTLTGRVRHLHQDQQRTALGLEFVKPDRKIESIIGKYISSVMLT